MASTSLPSAQPIRLASNVTLQPPLSRRGRGPGLLIFLPSHYLPGTQTSQKSLDPEPLQKWAEEGYCVVEIRTGQLNSSTFEDTAAWAEVDIVEKSLEALKNSLQFDTNTVGVIVYQDADISKYSFNNIASIKAAVLFTAVGEAEWGVPVMVHCSGASPTTIADGVTAHFYNSVKTGNFVLPGHANFDVSAAGVAHTRSLGFLKNHLGGPNFDLEAIWDEHTLFEFGERDVQKTMGTMVQEPYVNHVPTMTGGVGRELLTAFYRDHFVFNNPADTAMELVSRTVGVDRVIDEFIFSFTHDKVIDWIVPGIPPTKRFVRIPFTSVVNIRGDRLYHEHIAWDQATVLRQLGLLPEYLPFPYPLADGRVPAKGKRFEYRVPTAGIETAEKLVDESSVQSNGMFSFEIREVDDI